jgi:hypothetical protein
MRSNAGPSVWHVGCIDHSQNQAFRFEIIAQCADLLLVAKIDQPSPDSRGFREPAEVTIEVIVK